MDWSPVEIQARLALKDFQAVRAKKPSFPAARTATLHRYITREFYDLGISKFVDISGGLTHHELNAVAQAAHILGDFEFDTVFDEFWPKLFRLIQKESPSLAAIYVIGMPKTVSTPTHS